MRAIFSEKIFIDIYFLCKFSIIWIANCVLNKNFKLPGHFDKIAFFLLPFSFVSTQLGVQTSQRQKDLSQTHNIFIQKMSMY